MSTERSDLYRLDSGPRGPARSLAESADPLPWLPADDIEVAGWESRELIAEPPSAQELLSAPVSFLLRHQAG